MKKLQIQLPDHLYNDLKFLAEKLEYSLAELLRRGAEQILLFHPQILDKDSSQPTWKMPKPKDLGLKVSDPSELRKIANTRDN